MEPETHNPKAENRQTVVFRNNSIGMTGELKGRVCCHRKTDESENLGNQESEESRELQYESIWKLW
jgi:hypothetical protein